MFGGIVETIGVVTHIDEAHGCYHFTIAPQLVFDDLHIGDSIAVNGTCLTITAFTAHTFQVTIVPETKRLTNLGFLTVGQAVNLERSLKMNARLSGHYVQGHVDAVGMILAIENDHGKAWLVKISVASTLTNYIVKKGYIALDGMSITVIDVGKDWFTVTFIPHTQIATIVQHYTIGKIINVEVDMMGKYIEKLLAETTHADCI